MARRTVLKDILSEIIALRQEMQAGQPKHDDGNLKIIRFLVEDRAKDYRQILERIFGSLEVAVGIISARSTFEEVLHAAEYTIEIISGRIDLSNFVDSKLLLNASESMVWDVSGPVEDNGIASFALLKDKRIVLNHTALLKFDALQKTISLIAGE